MKEMTISLKGLTCANCAGKIEKAVGEMPETKEAEINLLKQEMRLVPAAEADRTKLLEKVTEPYTNTKVMWKYPLWKRRSLKEK